jgi:hypothetical protein
LPLVTFAITGTFIINVKQQYCQPISHQVIAAFNAFCLRRRSIFSILRRHIVLMSIFVNNAARTFGGGSKRDGREIPHPEAFTRTTTAAHGFLSQCRESSSARGMSSRPRVSFERRKAAAYRAFNAAGDALT